MRFRNIALACFFDVCHSEARRVSVGRGTPLRIAIAAFGAPGFSTLNSERLVFHSRVLWTGVQDSPTLIVCPSKGMIEGRGFQPGRRCGHEFIGQSGAQREQHEFSKLNVSRALEPFSGLRRPCPRATRRPQAGLPAGTTRWSQAGLPAGAPKGRRRGSFYPFCIRI
jgi:hypothetical protein